MTNMNAFFVDADVVAPLQAAAVEAAAAPKAAAKKNDFAVFSLTTWLLKVLACP